MAAQSGIAPTAELTSTWATALSSTTTRLLKITIDKEQLVPAAEFEVKGGFESDFELFGGEGVVEEQAPAYYLYR
ncbi:hypothetical protein BCR35DRAFT_334726 [Leucosporidium creatinivorum]|uniref:Uncharacterized protein n=1 Tax=Leucosporidium creatinivorum TaxID=106004 RepID=A0A1Y2DX08_9BASI|nr:hypothetical protein BCR35DRAFT_334726 [Leucosporidium creatinivorum]